MINRNGKLLVFFILVLALGLIFVWQKNSWIVETGDQSAQIINQTEGGEISPLSGLSCDNYQRRPIAVAS